MNIDRNAQNLKKQLYLHITIRAKENESNFIFPDESVSVKNKEEAESSGEEGAAHADFIDGDSNLTMRFCTDYL